MIWGIPKLKGGIVIHKPFQLMFSILLLMTILIACTAPTPAATITPIPPTPIPTGTPIPTTLTPTLELSPTESALLIEPGRIEGMVDIGGRSLYIECMGEGSPTIIMEMGWGADSSLLDYNNFYKRMTEITRTCRYDRANLGKSESAPTPRTFQDMVNDLHILLINAQIDGPYVLVGHSIGGCLVRLYAGQYPKEVVGMVLLDSSHPDQGYRMLAALPTESANEDANLTSERNALADAYERSVDDPEGLDVFTSAEQVRSVTSLGDMPLLVLTESTWSSGIPAIDQLEYNVWLSLQRELATLSTNSSQVIVPNTGHMMWYFARSDVPDEIINGISQVVQEVRIAQP
jgi:pimeloyl-ACP methyl ester carboxylesterase